MIIIKMPTYSYKKSLRSFFYSDPFYSSPSGYKLCLKVLAKGEHDGKGTHLSVYLKVLKGPYDSSLKWPITGLVAFELLNQLSDSNHYKQNITFQERNNFKLVFPKGISTFIRHSFIVENPAENTQYLMDDCLYFRVEVKFNESSLRPWLCAI